MQDSGKICMFTGHRDLFPNESVMLPQRLDELLEELISRGYTEFRAGGAAGFDTLAALKVLDKKKKYGFVRLHLYLPCHDQEKKWHENLKSVYYYVRDNADSVRYCSKSYYPGCMHKRNREMVDGSSVCVAFCSKSTGGTAYTVQYAKENGLKIVNLYKKQK